MADVPRMPSGDDGFAAAVAIVLAHEGGFQNRRDDPGNWTGGRIGAGALKGTKYGISAAAYPTLDIAALSPEEAAAIYRREWWERFGFGRLPPPLAAKLLDAAVNIGIAPATRALQRALRAAAQSSLKMARSAPRLARPLRRCPLLRFCRRCAKRSRAIIASSSRASRRVGCFSRAGWPALIPDSTREESLPCRMCRPN